MFCRVQSSDGSARSTLVTSWNRSIACRVETVRPPVLSSAAAMALDHIGIGRTALLIAFAITFGGIVLAAALAIGLGARDVVSRALERHVHGRSGEDKLDHV